MASRTKGPLWAEIWRWERQAQRLSPPGARMPEAVLGGWTPGPFPPDCGNRPSGGLPGNGCSRAQFSGLHGPYLPHSPGLRAMFSFKPLLPCQGTPNPQVPTIRSGPSEKTLHFLDPQARSSGPWPAVEEPGSPGQCPVPILRLGSALGLRGIPCSPSLPLPKQLTGPLPTLGPGGVYLIPRSNWA